MSLAWSKTVFLPELRRIADFPRLVFDGRRFPAHAAAGFPERENA